MKALVDGIKPFIQPLAEDRHDYDRLLHRVGDADIVLLGAQTHGTHEFYRERAVITHRLIAEKGFNAVGIEADWPDAYRVHRYVMGRSDDADAAEALGGFMTFPRWLWRNADAVDFVGELKAYNDSLLSQKHKVGFYGLDLYGLHKSIDAVIAYLEEVDPKAAKDARLRYSSFDHFGSRATRYGFGVRTGEAKSAEEEALRELIELRRHHAEWLRREGRNEDSVFYAEQNAQLIEDAERYYRAMFSNQTTAWNEREGHMARTVTALLAHLRARQGQAKIVIWSHNMHVGDARGTALHGNGQVSLGEVLRERYGRAVVLIGFTTDSGSVTAAESWYDSPPEEMLLKPAVQDSYEALFHLTGCPKFAMDLDEARWDSVIFGKLREARLQRNVGVVYQRGAELKRHYGKVRLPEQFDAVIHIDQTRAVEPLERTAAWEKGEVPETFPTGV